MNRSLFIAVGVLAGAWATLLGSGCASTPPARGFSNPGISGRGAESRLRVGDQIQVRIDTGGIATSPVQAYDVLLDENGEIALPLVGKIKAAGTTPAELAERIQANYVPRFYVRCTATVIASVRFFYVGGEVRAPGRFNWTEDITLWKALNTASGFTDFANRRKVEVSRGKEKKVFDCEELRQHPEQDIIIQPGDSIYVPRSIF
jgi:polysaccharide export outer membrane protein